MEDLLGHVKENGHSSGGQGMSLSGYFKKQSQVNMFTAVVLLLREQY